MLFRPIRHFFASLLQKMYASPIVIVMHLSSHGHKQALYLFLQEVLQKPFGFQQFQQTKFSPIGTMLVCKTYRHPSLELKFY